VIFSNTFWTYKTFMCHSWPHAVQPRILVGSPRGYECRCSHLLSIQSEADTSWAVLPCGIVPGMASDSKLKEVNFGQQEKSMIRTGSQIQLDTRKTVRNSFSSLAFGSSYLIWIILSHSEGWNSPIFLSLRLMKYILIIF
jgi:hypothetical protein